MDINSLSINPGDSVYYTPEFMNVLEDHLTYLREHPKTRTESITPHEASKYTGDLISLLNVRNVKPEYHWIIMRLNNFTNYSDIDENLNTLLYPDFEEIDRIKLSHKTLNKIKQ
jgi:hypothetical protein